MEENLLESYQNQAKAKETWTVKELKEFFEVSHTTVRKRIKEGELTATTRETETGKRYEVTGEELARNISQSEKLRNYLEKKTETQDQNRPDDPAGEAKGDLAQKYAELREELGKYKERCKHLEKENQDLKAKINELTETKALPSGSIFKPWTWFSSQDNS